MNIFRKMFSIRSIASFGCRPYKGVIYFYCRGMKVVGLHNKVHNWTSRFLIFEGDLGFAHTYPQERVASVFMSVQLDAMESAIVKFLADARLDIEYYIPLLASLVDVLREESKIFADLMFVSAATFVLTFLLLQRPWLCPPTCHRRPADSLLFKEKRNKRLQGRGKKRGILMRTTLLLKVLQCKASATAKRI
ncbi:hypothetical protein KSP40_PGU002271 [Platanthera guangdongensis]|uniref:Uncharacterized protein n=1 Tax=Platanthera guangdongensis TaxID=2320717 RepID=A0ABR2LPA5_9ASPA